MTSNSASRSNLRASNSHCAGSRDNFAYAYDSFRREHVLFGGNAVIGIGSYLDETLGDLWTLAPRAAMAPLREVPLGQVARVHLAGPMMPQLHYLVGLSQVTAPGIPILIPPLVRPVAWPLAPDRLWQVTLGMPGLIGTLDAQGQATAALRVTTFVSLSSIESTTPSAFTSERKVVPLVVPNRILDSRTSAPVVRPLLFPSPVTTRC